MGNQIGIVFVLSRKTSLDDVAKAFQGLVKISGNPLTSVNDITWELHGTLSLERYPLGFDVVQLLFKAGSLLDESRTSSGVAIEAIEKVMVAAIESIGPEFGYFSTHSWEIENDWIEQQVLIPLKANKWHEVIQPDYHLITFRSDAHEADFFWEGESIYEGERGILVRQGKTRNPYDL